MPASHAIPHARTPADEDRELQERFGITPVLARRQSWFAAWTAPFNIISVITGVVGTLATGMAAGGPAALFWGWIVVSACTLVVGVCMAELASSMPTAAALYHWTSQLAGPNRAPRWSHRVGWLNFLGLLGGVASVAYGGAISLQALIVLHRPTYTTSPERTLWITAGLLVLYGLVNMLDISRLSLVNKASALWLLGGTVFIALMLFTRPAHHQNTGFVLGHLVNETGFNASWGGLYAAVLVLNCGAYVYCGYDLAAHLSEETRSAADTVPGAILRSIWVSAVAGVALIGALLFAIRDYDGELGSGLGAAAQIFLDALGSTWGQVALGVAFGAQVFCGVAVVTAASRQVFAFSGRNKAFPGHQWWSRVAKRSRVPVAAVWLSVVLGFGLTLPGLWGSTVLNNVVSINVIGLLPAYAVPIFLRLRHRHDRFTPGPWNRGTAGPWYARVALVWITIACLVVIAPQASPITHKNFPYAGLALLTTLAIEQLWWWGRRHTYDAPVSTMTAAQAAGIQDEMV
jgi:amino acid transporter